MFFDGFEAEFLRSPETSQARPAKIATDQTESEADDGEEDIE
jgi:hypothetical protein